MRKTAGKRDVRFCTTGVFMLNDGTKERYEQIHANMAFGVKQAYAKHTCSA